MNSVDILVKIRKQLRMTSTQLSEKLGYHRTYWGKIECGDRPLASKTIRRLKDLLKVSLLILTTEDEKQFRHELEKWKAIIMRNDAIEAVAMQAQLGRTLEITPSDELKRLYDIYSIGCFRIKNDIDALDAQLSMLREFVDDFNDEESYWYHRQAAIRAHNLHDYPFAIDAFLKAEHLGDSLGFNEEGFYYNMGHCITSMGYANRAIRCFEKALRKADEHHSHAFDVYIKNLMCENYILVGRASDALPILNDCLHIIQQEKNSQVTIGLIYRRIAMAHCALGNAEMAIAIINKSFNYFDSERLSYIENLYYKALIYLINKKKRDAINILNEGIALAKSSSIIVIMLNTLKNSLSLKNDASREYIETVALPQLEKHCRNLPLIDCYARLGEHYKQYDKEKSSMYFEKAYALSEKLRKGDLSK